MGTTPEQPTIRPARREDVARLLDIYNDAILRTTAVYRYEPATLDEYLAWFDAKQGQGLPVLVAEDETGVTGFATFGPFRPAPAYSRTVEDSIYVAAEKRGLGVGTRLLDSLLGEARRRNLHAVVAGIDADNEPSCRLHARFGFVRVAHFRQVGFKFGRWLDLVFMERILTDDSEA
jgi:phosphinothricin acetyltransferase